MEKANFIAQVLPSMVGTGYFWMDILCIDHQDRDAKIAVTQHIPTIFRSAQRTIVIRDSRGIQGCVPEMAGLNIYEATKKLEEYVIATGHTKHEGVLSRLWLLQEVIVSDNIQFVRCEMALPRTETRSTRTPRKADAGAVVQSLKVLSRAWNLYGNELQKYDDAESLETQLNFIRAFINNGSISRKPVEGPRLNFPNLDWLRMHITSPRQTSKSRDFILAIMPQYAFYTVPTSVRGMTFRELFLDCYEQANSHGVLVTPQVWLGREDTLDDIATQRPATDNIPTPACLGDLVALFLGPKPLLYSSFDQLDPHDPDVELLGPMGGYRVEATQVIDTTDITQTCDIIDEAISQSRYWWLQAYTFWQVDSGFELEHLEPIEMEALSIVGTLAAIGHREGDPIIIPQIQSMVELNLPFFINSILQLATLIVCGFGVSAFRWSRKNLTPVLIKFRQKSILALVPSLAAPHTESV